MNFEVLCFPNELNSRNGEMGDPQPLIRNGNPTVWPKRGPLQKPSRCISQDQIKMILDENDMILSIVRNVRQGVVYLGNCSPAEQIESLMVRLHENMIYLAVAADLSKSNTHTIRK
jgi:hypothetical protein